jgi:hypothetical protein
MAADGMGHSQGYGVANIPYSAQKLHLANSSWVVGFCGWGGTEVHRKQLEAEIAASTQKFETDIDISGPQYLTALVEKLRTTYVPQQGTGKLILAGCGHSGLSVKVAELFHVENRLECSLLEAPRIAAYGSQAPTAKSILKLLRECCHTTGDLKELACFAIWQVANQELTVGQMERGYHLSACVLGRGSVPDIQNLPIALTVERMKQWQVCLQQSCSSFLSKRSSPAP